MRHKAGHGGAFGRLPTTFDLWRIAHLDRVSLGWPPHVALISLADHAYYFPGLSHGDPRPRRWPFLRIAPGVPADALGGVGHLYLTTVGQALSHDPDLPDALQWAARLFGGLPSAVAALPLVWSVPMVRKTPIPTYQPHFTLAFGGPLGADGESWSCRLNLTSSGALMTPAEADAAMPGIQAGLETLLDAPPRIFGPRVLLGYIKLNAILPDGRYADPTTRVHYYPVPRPSAITSGLEGRPDLPYQITLAASLLTALRRGKAHRGRLFLPSIQAVDQNGGRVNPGMPQMVADSVHAFLVAVNAACAGQTKVSIVSTTGQAQHVIGVEVGGILDTMRSRRRSLKEKPVGLSAQDL